jgi:outer membrane protein assembly factor BamB
MTEGSSSSSQPGHQPEQYIGYWYDGSGVIPGCDLVSEWNETEFTKDGRHEKPVGKKHVNIVYKVPHYNWCNGGMIIVNGKLFTMSDRGGYGFYADRAADFVGAELFCIDPATGKELWKRDLDHWDLLPNPEGIRKTILEYNKLEAKIYGAYAPLGSAMRSRGKVKLTPERYLELAKPLRDLIPDLPATLGDIKGHIIDSRGYEQLHFYGKVMPKYFPKMAEMRKKILKMGYLMDPWGGKWDPLGISMMTPVSDGKNIYVSTAYGAVFCYDLDGNLRWKRWFGGGMDRAPAIPSPILVDGMLIVTTHPPDAKKPNRGAVRMALDKTNGKVIWTARHSGSYQTGPTALRLHVGGEASKPMTVLYYQGNGVVLRASDGVQLAEGLPEVWTGRPTAVDGDVLVGNNRLADGGGSSNIKNKYDKGWAAFRLKAPTRDKVEVELLWQGKKLAQDGVVAEDGIVYHLSDRAIETFELETGKLIAQKKGRLKDSRHYTMLLGDTLMGLDDHGFSTVATVSPDGKTISDVRVNRLGTLDYGKHQPSPMDKVFQYGAQFTASGNRLFIRSNTHLYCIGDPDAKMVLNPEHREK